MFFEFGFDAAKSLFLWKIRVSEKIGAYIGRKGDAL